MEPFARTGHSSQEKPWTVLWELHQQHEKGTAMSIKYPGASKKWKCCRWPAGGGLQVQVMWGWSGGGGK